MVTAEEGVRPGARPRERVVLDHDRTVQHLLLLAVCLEPLVRLRPDALRVVDLAEPVPRAAAGAVALVLRALGLRAHVRDLRERAVAAVPAREERHLGRLLERVRRSAHGAGGRVEPPVDAPGGRAQRCVAREDLLVHAPAEAVRERHPQVGAPSALRLEVGGVHALGREAGVRLFLEEVELAGQRVPELAHERAPVVREGRREVENLAERLGRHVPAEVDAVVAEPAHDRDVLRGQLDEERQALVGARALPLRELEQRVAHDDARDLAAAKRPGGGGREEVHVRDRGERQAVAPDPAEQLVVLAHVPADLVDDEACPRLRLPPELEVLGHHLPLVALVVRDHAPQEEVRLLEPRLRPPLVAQPGVHLGEEVEEAHRVDVEHRRGETAVPGDRVVAGEREHVVESLRGELPAAALECVPVPVLAREVDDHLLAARDHVRPESVGCQHRVAAGVVGDREHVDPWIGGERARELEHPRAPVGRDQSAAGDDLGGDHESLRLGEQLAEGDDRAHRDVGGSTGGVPYVWKLSIVCTPQNCPRARSAAVHTVGSKSGS